MGTEERCMTNAYMREEGKNQSLLEQYDEKCRLFQSFVVEVEHQIKSILQANQITCNAIVSRLKSRESVAEKIERKQGKYGDISEMTDIAGVRIITYYSGDVDKIAEVIESEFDVDKENSIDKREAMEPDRFGYCSVHYVVRMSSERLALCEYQAFEGMKCEIQIRSVLQHAWAEIEHDIGYKSEITLPKEMRRSFSRIAGLLEIADKEFDEIRKSLTEYKDEVQSKFENDIFLEHEVDAVLLEAIINSNLDIRRINQYIQELTGEPVVKIESNGAYEFVLNYFKWLGLTTVREVYDMIQKYTQLAMEVATKKLQNNIKNGGTEFFREDVAFFYLCYACLLKEYCDKEKILSYLEETNIGADYEREDVAQELYNIGLSLK